MEPVGPVQRPAFAAPLSSIEVTHDPDVAAPPDAPPLSPQDQARLDNKGKPPREAILNAAIKDGHLPAGTTLANLQLKDIKMVFEKEGHPPNQHNLIEHVEDATGKKFYVFNQTWEVKIKDQHGQDVTIKVPQTIYTGVEVPTDNDPVHGPAKLEAAINKAVYLALSFELAQKFTIVDKTKLNPEQKIMAANIEKATQLFFTEKATMPLLSGDHHRINELKPAIIGGEKVGLYDSSQRTDIAAKRFFSDKHREFLDRLSTDRFVPASGSDNTAAEYERHALGLQSNLTPEQLAEESHLDYLDNKSDRYQVRFNEFKDLAQTQLSQIKNQLQNNSPEIADKKAEYSVLSINIAACDEEGVVKDKICNDFWQKKKEDNFKQFCINQHIEGSPKNDLWDLVNSPQNQQQSINSGVAKEFRQYHLQMCTNYREEMRQLDLRRTHLNKVQLRELTSYMEIYQSHAAIADLGLRRANLVSQQEQCRDELNTLYGIDALEKTYAEMDRLSNDHQSLVNSIPPPDQTASMQENNLEIERVLQDLTTAKEELKEAIERQISQPRSPIPNPEDAEPAAAATPAAQAGRSQRPQPALPPRRADFNALRRDVDADVEANLELESSESEGGFLSYPEDEPIDLLGGEEIPLRPLRGHNVELSGSESGEGVDLSDEEDKI